MAENNSFKRIEVSDVFDSARIAIFERPLIGNDTVIISLAQPGDFHLDAGTLKTISTVLDNPKV